MLATGRFLQARILCNWIVGLFIICITLLNLLVAWTDFQMLLDILANNDDSHFSENIPVGNDGAVLIFKADTHYGMLADEDWESLMPSGYQSGFIRLNASENPFELSIYHQFHCLNNLRKIYMQPGWAGDDHKTWHVNHCLNFIRQAILCNGDTTLEPSFDYILDDGRRAPAAHGMDVAHECRDWTIVRAFTENNYRAFKDVPFKIVARPATL